MFGKFITKGWNTWVWEVGSIENRNHKLLSNEHIFSYVIHLLHFS